MYGFPRRKAIAALFRVEGFCPMLHRVGGSVSSDLNWDAVLCYAPILISMRVIRRRYTYLVDPMESHMRASITRKPLRTVGIRVIRWGCCADCSLMMMSNSHVTIQ